MSGTSVFCQITRQKTQDQIYADSLGIKAFQKSQLKSNDFYDNVLKSKSGFVRWIGHLLIGARSSADDAAPIPEIQISRDYFDLFKGQTITNIDITMANIFSQSDKDDLSWAENTLDKLHVRTRESVIAKNLLFHIGDTLNPYVMAINEQLLRSKSYMATAFFVIVPDRHIPNSVEVRVFTRDNWTISAGGTLGGTPRLDVFDRNFVGTGNMLLLRYYAPGNYQNHGAEINYIMDNALGTFATASIKLGIGSTNNIAQLIVDRKFLKPSDHIWGLKIGIATESNGIATMDTTLTVNYQTWNGYYGYSWNIDQRMGTGVYTALSAGYTKYHRAPEYNEWLNPYYTTRFTAALNIGVSRQNFFQGNMIYGYGRTEDIPYGFKFELMGAYEINQQLGNRWYVGAQARWGKLTNAGYFNLGLTGGTYITPARKPQQSMWNFGLNYFSPLWNIGNLYIRQFLTTNYTQGLYRKSGEREVLGFSNPGIRGMSTPWESLGTNRYMINTETVFFTPLFLYHFRFAFFGWFDCGWLGMDNNVFKNPFASALGLGVRIKNERLIFNNIQLRFGFALKNLPGGRFNWFQLSNENAWAIDQFIPRPPTIYPYE